MAKCQGVLRNVCTKKRKQGFIWTVISILVSLEAIDKRIECVICVERLANESMKLTRHQSTKHPLTLGKPREIFLRKKYLVISNRPQNIRDAFTRAAVASFECALLITQSKKRFWLVKGLDFTPKLAHHNQIHPAIRNNISVRDCF